MIYCNLKGGLGNMLFQIATAKSFSLQKNTECFFPNFYSHLDYLNKETQFNKKLNYSQEYSLFLKLNSKQPMKKINIYSYPFEYTEFLPNENDFFIDGFFQSEKYFVNFKKQILDFFRPSNNIENYIKNKYNFLLQNNSIVGLHVRRGDYLNHSNMHPCQAVEYYNNAYNEIKNKINIDCVIVFSDDIEWCKKNLSFENMFFIENEKDYIELFLMSYCSHNIISNSSFSWWGAWLNENNNKIIVCPSMWFGSGLSHLETTDLYPQGWIKI